MSKVKSLSYVGTFPTRDLEVEHPDHQYYTASGILSSNSHATSYALVSYYCAYLLHHYTPEWLCAYMEDCAEKDKKRSKAMGEITSFGYAIKNIDVSHATDKWTILDDNAFMPSLLTIKGVGQKAIDELVAKRPFTSIEDMMWDEEGKWRWSKFNKKAWDNLIKVQAFDSLDCVGPGKTFDDYHHMHRVIVGENATLRKPKKGKLAFSEIVERERAAVPDWSRAEKIEFYKTIIGHVNLDMIISAEKRERLRVSGIECIDHMPEDKSEDVAWFVINEALLKKSRNGKTYVLINGSGEFGGRHRIYCWGAKETALEKFRPGRVGLAPLKRSDFGFGTQAWNIKFVRD